MGWFENKKRKLLPDYSYSSRDKYLSIFKGMNNKSIPEIVGEFKEKYINYDDKEKEILIYTLNDYINDVDKITLISIVFTIMTFVFSKVSELFGSLTELNTQSESLKSSFNNFINKGNESSVSVDVNEIENQIKSLTNLLTVLNIFSIVATVIVGFIVVYIIINIIKNIREYRLCKLYISVIENIEKDKSQENYKDIEIRGEYNNESVFKRFLKKTWSNI